METRLHWDRLLLLLCRMRGRQRHPSSTIYCMYIITHYVCNLISYIITSPGSWLYIQCIGLTVGSSKLLLLVDGFTNYSPLSLISSSSLFLLSFSPFLSPDEKKQKKIRKHWNRHNIMQRIDARDQNTENEGNKKNRNRKKKLKREQDIFLAVQVSVKSVRMSTECRIWETEMFWGLKGRTQNEERSDGW